jgi:hypothetical protein
LTDTRISLLEQQLKIVLPSEYRSFLARYNGGTPNPPFFPIQGLEGNPFGEIHVFLGVDIPVESSNLDWSYRVYCGRLPHNLFPIAYNTTGDVICLSLTGQDKGAVYFWDHEKEHKPPSYQNVHLVAPSFREFLECIHFRDISSEVAAAIRGGKVIH